MAVYWVVAWCSLVEVYRRFRGIIALMMKVTSTSETSVNFYQTTRPNTQKTAISIALMMEAARTSETLVNFYQTTRHCNPEEAIFLAIFILATLRT
jgi:hypothetical protein